MESSPGKLPALEQSTQWFYCICICICIFNDVGILASNCLRPNFFNVSSSFAFGSVPLHLVLFLIVFVFVSVFVFVFVFVFVSVFMCTCMLSPFGKLPALEQ